MQIPVLWFAALTAVLSATLSGLPAIAQASAPPTREPQHAVLVELFTSEGCSSCPPADQLLRAINGKGTADGQMIVGLSEHVTYWNQLGWRDRFSADVFTDRQNRYAEHLHLDEVYTPQMIVNGREQFVGSNSAALREALHREALNETPSQTPNAARNTARNESVPLQIESIQPAGNALLFHFRVGALPAGHPVEIVAVLTDDADQTDVKRGENAGTSLQHLAVARLLAPVATVTAAAEREIRLPLPPDSAALATPGHHLVLLAQDSATGAVLGTAVQALR